MLRFDPFRELDRVAARYGDAVRSTTAWGTPALDLAAGVAERVSVVTLALESIGHTDNQLYDGSWTEWGGRPDTPVATGKA